MPERRVGWQPSRFLTDRGEAQLAERLGSVNAAAQQLGTSWPSLRKAFGAHSLGMPAAIPRPSASAPSLPPAAALARPPPASGPGVYGPQPGSFPRPARS
jgi:hypothetical protein